MLLWVQMRYPNTCNQSCYCAPVWVLTPGEPHCRRQAFRADGGDRFIDALRRPTAAQICAELVSRSIPPILSQWNLFRT